MRFKCLVEIEKSVKPNQKWYCTGEIKENYFLAQGYHTTYYHSVKSAKEEKIFLHSFNHLFKSEEQVNG